VKFDAMKYLDDFKKYQDRSPLNKMRVRSSTKDWLMRWKAKVAFTEIEWKAKDQWGEGQRSYRMVRLLRRIDRKLRSIK
jgi:hypothetical protein